MRSTRSRTAAILLAITAVASAPPCAAQPPREAPARACPQPPPSFEGEWTDGGEASIAVARAGTTVSVTLTRWNIPGPLSLTGSGCLYGGRFTTRRTLRVDPDHTLEERVYEGEARLTIESTGTIVLHVQGRSYSAVRGPRDATQFEVTSTLRRRS